MDKKINVTIWNEFRHEKNDENVKKIHPNGIHATIAGFLSECDDLNITLAALDDPDQGLPDEVLNNTDVLMWWGHAAHGEVDDKLVDRICSRVFDKGMGFVALHSAHFSKPFKKLVGTSGNLSWGSDQKEIIWNMMPSHPIAAGIPDHVILDVEELYAEPFAIPQPDELVFTSWFEHGFVFRSGCCYHKGAGKIFYFQPGHESCPSYHNPIIQRIIKNGVHWAAPNEFGFNVDYGCNWIPPVV